MYLFNVKMIIIMFASISILYAFRLLFDRLQREVTEIRESVRILKERLKASELSLARLMKTKATLEHDIGVKDNTVKIDTSYCMGMRKGFPMDPKIGPVFQMPTC